MIKARQLNGGLILSKYIIDLVSFNKNSSIGLAEAPFNSWAERETKIMCLGINIEDEEENVPIKSVVK